jgi:hypothetical protein
VRPDGRDDAPGAPGFRITELHAFIAVDPRDDSEGVVGHMNPHTGVMEAMIGADKDRIESLRPIAEEVARATGQPIKLVRFSQREDKEEFR